MCLLGQNWKVGGYHRGRTYANTWANVTIVDNYILKNTYVCVINANILGLRVESPRPVFMTILADDA